MHYRIPHLVILAVVLILFISTAYGDQDDSAPHDSSDATQKIGTFVFTDPEFKFELIRTLSGMAAGEADLGECLATAGRITEGDFESWYTEWNRTGSHFRTVGDEAYAQGNLFTAHDAYLRAQTYLRTAEFFLHGNPDDPRILDTWERSRDTFTDAMKLDPVTMESVRIPYEDTTLPGYLYTAPDQEGKRPLLIIQTGYDGTQEELRSEAIEGVRRGYTVLTFEGPGQGEMIRVQHIPFRPDWEAVVTPVIDWAVTRPEVDPDRIALWGISFGGYLAPRAATAEHRITALIADSGIIDMAENEVKPIKEGFPDPANTTRSDVLDYIQENQDEMNREIYDQMNKSVSTRWIFQQGMYAFGVDSPAEMMLAFADYSLDGMLDRITAHTLVCDGTNDSKMGSQAWEFFESLDCPKDYLLFTNEYGAGEHCQIGASAQSMEGKFDWLDGVLKPGRDF